MRLFVQRHSDPTARACGQYRLGAVRYAEASVDPVKVRTHGALRDSELQRDLLSALARPQAPHDPELAFRQWTALSEVAVDENRIRLFVQQRGERLAAQAGPVSDVRQPLDVDRVGRGEVRQ